MFFKGFFYIFLVFAISVKAQTNEDPITPSASTDEDIETDDEGIVTEKMEKDIVTDITSGATPETEEQSIVDGVPIGAKNIETEMMFIEPPLNKRSSGAGVEIPANKLIVVLASFKNNELQIADDKSKNFKLDYVEGFLRYPTDYSYFLQNFTAKPLDTVVEPLREATIEYAFIPSHQLSGRPFGLTIRVAYHDGNGKLYTSTFFNDTIQIIEIDEGFDTESLFLYVLVVGVIGLALFGLYHLFNVYALRKLKKSNVTKPTVDINSSLKNEVDLQWVPKEHLRMRQSPTLSPRKRKTKRHEDNHVSGGH